MDVGSWLRKLGLEQYKSAFRENDIDDTVLPGLTAEDLKDLGVGSVGHRRKLLDAIAALRAEAKAPTQLSDAPLTPEKAATDTAERRQVAVMFSDLVGSTSLSARMDPEDLREIISAYQTCVADAVRRFGGFVAKYMGDGVLVYFGYPAAHEDDAERAVRAGLALIDAVATLKAPEPLQVRIGAATGLVVAGDLIGFGEAQERGIVGETPNLAARLQGIAEPSTVVIAEATRNLLGNLFELRDLGPKELKGIAGPVRAFAALRASSVQSRFEAMHAGGLTALVGREEERELLLRRWARAKTGEGQVVLLSGEAGIGKSRLTAALMEGLAAEPHTRLRYFCSPQHTDSVFYPLIGHLERAAGFAHGDTPQTKLDKLNVLLAQTSTSRQDAALLAEMLSLPNDGRHPALELDPEQRRRKTLEALDAQLETLARSSPVLMVIEDAHWADPTSLEAFGRTVDRIRSLRVLMVVTFRPEFEAPWVGQSHVTALALNRLGHRDVGSLIDRVVGNKPLPADIRKDIVERTDGIPLFVEEMTKAVLEAGGDLEAMQTAAAVPYPASAVPASLHASLMARLDRLGPAKEVAQIGAAIGREFSYELLVSVAPLGDERVQDALGQLTASGLVFQRGTPPYAAYLFKHALVQDAAYGTLLKSKRQQLHSRIVRVLEEGFRGTAETQPELLAHHCAQAGRIEKAIAYRYKAARQAMARSGMAEAVAQLRKALELLTTLPADADRDRREFELQVALGGAFVATKGFAAPEVGQTYARARELCWQGAEGPQALPVLAGLYQYHSHVTGPEFGREIAEELLRLAEQQQDAAARVVGYRISGVSSLFGGHLAAAREHFARALALYASVDRNSAIFLPFPETEVACRSFKALVLLWQGYPDQALACGDAALAAAHELGHAFSESHALYLNCWLHQVRGEPGIVRERASAMISVTTEHNYPAWLAYAKVLHGWALAATGAREAGIAQMHEGIAETAALGVQQHRPSLLGLLAGTYGRERSDEALTRLAEALAMVARSGEHWFEAELRRLSADVLFAGSPGEASKAEASLHSALAVAREQGAKWWELRATMSMARLWRDQGKRDEARDLLAPIYGWFTEGFDTLDLKQAKALLDELAA